MKLETIKQKLLGDERAVSPVIGVILMVAITVILAAVIGTFVLGLGENVSQTTPQSSFSFSDAQETHDDGDTTAQDFVAFQHTSGDPVKADQVKITIRNDANQVVATWDDGSIGPGAAAPGSGWAITKDGAAFAGSTIEVGDVVTIEATDASGQPANGDYTVTVIHKPSDSTIASGTVSVS